MWHGFFRRWKGEERLINLCQESWMWMANQKDFGRLNEIVMSSLEGSHRCPTAGACSA
jgi:hypothetical protein